MLQPIRHLQRDHASNDRLNGALLHLHSIHPGKSRRIRIENTKKSPAIDQYDCRSAPMEFNGVAQSWWTDRSGMRHVDFTGANSGQSRCQCALEGNCLDKELGCNCNSVSPIPTSDTGLITDKTLLPVTRLNFGRILTPPASGRHTLGRMTCFGRLFASPSKPSSCQDLWRSGHTISGFYQVQDSPAGGIETVFCDMTQVPGQGSIASPDLKQVGCTNNPCGIGALSFIHSFIR